MKTIDEMMSVEKSDRERFKLTKENIDSLLRYVEHGIEPGSFLKAVLCNDLTDACGRADVYNRRKLFEYIEWLYNEAPAECWGSEEKVLNWTSARVGEFKERKFSL